MNLEMRLSEESVAVVGLVYDFFKDPKKAYLWLTTKNSMLGNISPLYLINVGRAGKVLKFIHDAKDGNW